jgi:hypothetical protein
MGMNLLWTFFSCRVQPLRQWVTTMWLYSQPSCPDHPLSEKMGEAEINTQIHRDLAHEADLNPGASPTPLREGVDNTRVSPFAFIIGNLRKLVCSLNSFLITGSCVCSQCAAEGHLT